MLCDWGGMGLADVGAARLTVCGGADLAFPARFPLFRFFLFFILAIVLMWLLVD